MTCPILQELQESTADLARSVRRIRRGFRVCTHCAAHPCPALSQWEQCLSEAIQELVTELRREPLSINVRC